MRATLILADYVAAADGKLTVVGGGWSITVPGASPFALGGIIEVPWSETNRPLRWRLRLQDADGQAVTLQAPLGPQPVAIDGLVEVGRPVGAVAGDPLPVPIALNMGPLPLPVDQRFTWILEIDGETDEHWQVSFRTVASLERRGTAPT